MKKSIFLLKFIGLISLLFLFTLKINSQPNLRSKTKKLIPVGRETPFSQSLNDNQASIESQPFHTNPITEKQIKQVDMIIDSLKAAGVFENHESLRSTTDQLKFEFPLSFTPDTANGVYSAYARSSAGFFDHDPTSGLLDFMGGTLTYDGHQGTDWYLTPFRWYSMDNNLVSVIAAAPGIIVTKIDGNYDRVIAWNDSLIEGWNGVIIQHSDGTKAWYIHFKKNSLTTKNVGDYVETGEFLGLVGSSGISSGPHLHFQVMTANNKAVDPFFGPSNPDISESMWVQQPPYLDKGINRLLIGSAPPVNPKWPNPEILNEKRSFVPGDPITFSFYAKWPLEDVFKCKVLKPDGSIWEEISGTSKKVSTWKNKLAIDAPIGVWHYEVQYNSITYSLSFTVGDTSALPEIVLLSTELIACVGTENNYIECNAYSNYGQELHYEWYKDYSRLGYENSSKLVFSKFDSNSTGEYQCMVYIHGGSEVWSDIIPVYALSTPEIIDHPKDIVDAIIGETYKFEVKLKSNGKLSPYYNDSIQWYRYTAKTNEMSALKDVDRYSGTNTLQLVITELSKSDICEKGDYYFAEIKSRCGKVISNHFTISKISEIVIINNSKDTSICEGNVVEIKIDYNSKNCDSLSFQWFFNDKPISKNDDIEFDNANLKLSNTNKNYSGKYFLEISAINENIKVKSESINLTVYEKPQIISQSPESIIIFEDESFELKVDAVSFDTIHYQWYKDSKILPGYNSNSIIKKNAKPEDTGVYHCEILNSCGKVKSKEIILKINPLISVDEKYECDLFISPNPASDYIEIRQASEGLGIKIINCYGQCVLNLQDVQHLGDVGHLKRIDISRLPIGMYFIRIGNYSEKFIIVR